MPSASYERRNARARAAGYASYYDYRVHNHGRISASQPAPTGESRSRLRGHRGRADFERALRQADHVVPAVAERDAKGRVTAMRMVVIDRQGKQRFFRVPVSKTTLPALAATLDAAGIRVYGGYRKLLGGEEEAGDELGLGEDEEEAA